MLPAVLSGSSSGSHEASRVSDDSSLLQQGKKKRKVPGNPEPDAKVIALSPETLMATNRYICQVCNKGFQREQNLQLHLRGHNLPWKLKQRDNKDSRKKVYVCPEPTCVHHEPLRALGDLTGIKKHYCRKHGDKKWKCERCSKVYAVQSDWKAHSKTCGAREHKCHVCGTLFTRNDGYIAHRSYCNALAEETARISAAYSTMAPHLTATPRLLPFLPDPPHPNPNYAPLIYSETAQSLPPSLGLQSSVADDSTGDGITRDFLGLVAGEGGGNGGETKNWGIC